MLSAKPVVVTQDSGGAAELIEHGRDGMIVEPDARAIAESLDQLYSNREDATRMGRSGREKLLAMKLSWQNVVKKIISAAE
jgi:glycosyltransferase involved in cell wall biosynthesis